MHYYQFNIGDYRRDTAHLSMLEHGAFRQLMDQYYLKEKPIPEDIEMRTLCACTAEEVRAVKYILDTYFTLTSKGFINKSCDQFIKKYKNKSEKARQSANARWNKELSSKKEDANALRPDTEGNANHKPLTTNHKPNKDRQEKKKTFLESDFNLAKQMHSLILEINNNQKEPNFNVWANSIRLIRERDKKTIEEIAELFKWANNNDFWRTNILSPEKLRKQWDKLIIQKQNKPNTQSTRKMSVSERASKANQDFEDKYVNEHQLNIENF